MTSSASSSNVAVMSSLRIKLMFVLLLLLGSCCCRDISGAVFGLESPIELIEEWACQDVPIRLTCPRLDSKIVVLEATFSPNCTDSKNCHVFDSNGRLTRVFLKHSRHDYRLQETAAGRRFLQTLRKSQENYKERITAEEGGASREGEQTEPARISHSSSSDDHGDQLSLWDTMGKDDTIELKLSLEKLIVEYLKKLSPEEDFEAEEYSRLRRHLMDMVEPTIDSSGGGVIVDASDEHVNAEEEGGGGEEGVEEEEDIEEYTSNEVVSNSSQVELVSSDGDVVGEAGSAMPKKGSRGGKRRRVSKKCANSRRVVSSLSALDIEKAQQNETEKDYNIRRIINYRCSGKNHCNFLFEQDHPFNLIWRSGIVRIKYACMNEFRITKYCGEILPIGNERRFDNSFPGHEQSEPIVAARMQMLNDQSFHQFTNLKIIKADEKPPKNRRKLSPPKKVEQEVEQKDPSIYSQDFRTLKILPADTIDFNEIELIGEDFYFGNKLQNEDEFGHAPATTTATATEDSPILLVDSYDVERVVTDGTELPLETVDEVGENNLLDGTNQRSTTTADDQHLDNLVIANTVTLMPGRDEVVDVNTRGGKLLLGSEDYSVGEEDEDRFDEDDDDYYYDDEYEILHRNKGPRKYKSIARTQLKKPLLQGFIMSPGYPKFYVGEMECKYIVKAPKFHQIRITLFDVSLRSDLPCRDFVEIEDVIQRKSLYWGCQEQSRPLSIVTGSHIARIKLNTTTKTAYPKRGVLIHYQAVNCVQPQLPKNVILVDFNSEEGTLKVACEHPDFVFPDTSYPERMLRCSPTHVAWDRSIPPCIELEQASGSGLVSHLNGELLSSSVFGAASSGAAMNKPADVVVDVIVPCVIIGALFLVNGLIMMMIMKRRNQSNTDNNNPRELEDI